MHSSPPRNRLASESSLYLLQHAGNPVDWYPWGSEALELARRLDRPILLSVGYSACHWCHVMERECFENPDIAALMNREFVCIKVDREERPDIDQLYMKALQGMTGRGGWPMTMFLTPDARPFFGGTYFPPEDRGGMPGFPRVLLGVAKTWSTKRGEVVESAGRMVDFLGDPGRLAPGVVVDEAALAEAAATLVASMDREHGGFGREPKFPGSMALSLLMETGAGIEGADGLVRLSLDGMAAGGMRDHLGGGFHRYSVDRVWLVPHFEKMLYDQALMAVLYAEASKCFSEPAYAEVATHVLDYVVAEMTSSDGGFFSAQDADSEGEEGKYFVWKPEEVADSLGPERSPLFCEAYDVAPGGNFEGASILRRVRSAEELARAHGVSEAVVEARLAEGRQLLLQRRRRRPAPATDRKILTDWNGLMVSAMASVGRQLGREDLVDVAVRALEFLRHEVLLPSGLRHVHASGVAKVPAFLDDYAFFGRASLDVLSVRPRAEYFETARCCADRLLAEFRDEGAGGFHFTAGSSERLVARPSDLHDGAVPAGNSVAAELMLRLWSLTGDDRYRVAGESVIARFGGEALRQPYGASHLLAVAGRHRRGLTTVVVAGEAESRATLSAAAREAYHPGAMVIALGTGHEDWWPSAFRGKPVPAEGARAYVCEGLTCGMPEDEADRLRAALHRGRRRIAAAEERRA
jgi:uncharacterized protein YyaL (SSP411 family)